MSNLSETSLGTLAAKALVSVAGSTMTRGGTALSVRGPVTIHSLTAGDGPFLLGQYNADLSDAEVEAYIEQNGPTHPDDTIEVAIADRGRKIRFLGMLVPSGNGTICAKYLADEALKGLRFSEEAGGWKFFLYNTGKAMTTGATWIMHPKTFVRWNQGG